MKNIVLCLAISALMYSCTNVESRVYSPFYSAFEPMGRVGANADSSAMEIYWSGSGIKVCFEGTGISMRLKDESHENYFNVILDKDSIVLLRPDTVESSYVLAENLPEGHHCIELFKRTEWTRGTTWIYAITPAKGTLLVPVEENERSIEFYGNSITCGFGVEDYSGQDSPDSIFTNNYATYAAITARYFDADYTCISRSGIGLTVSWFNQLMQDIYHLGNPNMKGRAWDFSKHQKDVVVVNLFQNDSWLVLRKEHEEFKRRFGDKTPEAEQIIDTYFRFITELRSLYPAAHIICMLGNMDITREGSPWPTYVSKAVSRLNDDKIHTLFAPYKNTGGHPREAEQRVMAEQLIDLVNKEHMFE